MSTIISGDREYEVSSLLTLKPATHA